MASRRVSLGPAGPAPRHGPVAWPETGPQPDPTALIGPRCRVKAGRNWPVAKLPGLAGATQRLATAGGFNNSGREQGPDFVRSYRHAYRLTRLGMVLSAAAFAVTMADAQHSRILA